MPAPESIRQLVARFTDQRDIYRSGKYNETQLRNDFLDPFFEALGWDINNRKNYSEKFREVVKEVSLEVDGTAKAADYAFQSGGHVHFFVEAKKPAVNIDSHPDSAFQIRRYGWSAKLNVSILSDFEQLAVYDCRQKPVHGDPAYLSRANLYSFTEYIDKWDEIAGLLSYEAVHQGSLDKFTDSLKGKRGTADVDDAFLAEMEHWREELARVIALRNNLSQREINTAVQLIIDRIIFLRICEDRGIEPENGLREATDGIDVYGDLMELFKKADKKYNSGLFHFDTEKGQSSHPDTLTPTLKIDDKVFKDILANLYLPKSPYAFNYFSAEILGQVYERFLGKVIRLTAGGHAKVEEKPEVRKAGGVYYTPSYIVDYIVKNTVGELLKDKTPETLQADPIRIVDPACGSGSFLLGAYQFLLDWVLNWYIANDPAKWAKGKNPPIYEGDKAWQLTMEKKKELLTSHIFGVDIDSQAVEVTKLSLLLKVVENPGQLTLLGERILPDLGENIKCGNSLIGPDYYDNQQLNMFDTEEQYRVNAFDWHRSFPNAFAKGGFDAVIGNPPWGADLSEFELAYLRKTNHSIIVRMIDSFMYFVYQSKFKLRQNGYFGMILPDVIFYQKDNWKLREFLLKESTITNLINMGNVFEKVNRPSSIITFKNIQSKSIVKIQNLTKNNTNEKKNLILSNDAFINLDQDAFYKIPDFLFITDNPENYDIWNKIVASSQKPLSDFIDEDGIQRGVSPDLKDAFIVSKQVIDSYSLEKEKIKKVLTGGKQVKKYHILDSDLWLLYITEKDDIKKIPNIKSYIESFKNQITCKEVINHKHSLYSLHRPRKEKIFQKNEKALGVITEDEIVICIDRDQIFASDGLYLFGVIDGIKLNYIVAILNSKLMQFVYRLLSIEEGRTLAQVKPTTIQQIPIHAINFSDPAEVAQHDRMVNLVENMLNLHKLSAAARLPDEKDRLARQIQQTDQQIDKLVYQLYNLTPDEIKIVEGV